MHLTYFFRGLLLLWINKLQDASWRRLGLNPLVLWQPFALAISGSPGGWYSVAPSSSDPTHSWKEDAPPTSHPSQPSASRPFSFRTTHTLNYCHHSATLVVPLRVTVQRRTWVHFLSLNSTQPTTSEKTRPNPTHGPRVNPTQGHLCYS